MVLIIAAVALTWYFGKNYITAFVYQVRLYEIIGINYILNAWNSLAAFLHLPVSSAADLAQWEAYIRAKALGADFSTMQQVSTDVGSYLRFPIIAVLAILAFIVYSKNVTLKFKTVFNMKRFRALEQENWPQITPIVKLDLVKQDINKGPWAMALTPMQFCKNNKLLKEEIKDDHPTAELIHGAAHQAFVLQLGALWTHADALPIHVKALFAMFAACANQDRESATKLLHQIAASSAHGKLDFNGAQELLDKHKNSKIVAKVVQRHAYVYSVLASMLELARTDGVFASSEFLWLKPVDRRFWYMMNSVGRQTSVPEISGPFAHWLAEKKLGRPMRVPMVDEAVKGLEAALSDIIYEPDED